MGVSEAAWHDLECGSYRADLDLWRELAGPRGAEILELGAGTGRVALALADAGHRVLAVEREPALHRVLAERGAGRLRAICADARELSVPERFDLAIVAMQTVQIVGGESGRSRLLSRIREHLRPGGRAALAIVERLGTFEDPTSPPEEMRRGPLVLSSAAVAVRRVSDGYELERRRRVRADDGSEREAGRELITIDRLSARALEREGAAAGLHPQPARRIAATAEHAGSTVVILGG